MRFALVILIAVVQVAGPWLCCCGPARMMGAVPAIRKTTVAPVPVSIDCPHCRKSEVPANPMPPHEPESCPCGGVELLAVPAERPTEMAVAFTSTVEPFGFAVLVAPVVSQSVASVPGLRELPNLTVHDLLYKHHVLRC